MLNNVRHAVVIMSFIFIAAVVIGGKSKRPVSRFDIIKGSTELKLAYPGPQTPIQYKKYGSFEGVGTTDYRYTIKDKKGLASAAGEGVFPSRKVFQDKRYRQLKKEGKLNGNHWGFVDGREAEFHFYKWATTSDEPGIKQYYTAIMLERAGLIVQAIKAYYAIALHFPKSVGMTYYKTPWYVGTAVLDRVEHLIRRHPHIKMELKGGRIFIRNRFDNDPKNDEFVIDPGKLVRVKKQKKPKVLKLREKDVVQTVAGPRTELKKYKNGHWKMFVDGKPFVMKALSYSVTPVGLSPDRGTWNVSKDWQLIDSNKNGIHDGFFESYLDENENGVRDGKEKIVGDAELIKNLGANTFRAYHHIYNKELFRRLHKDYGFYVLCGDLIGAYAVGSGAKWEEGTDYSNPKQRETMLAGVRKMVEDNRDEPYILMWLLGNENAYGVGNNSNEDPVAFYKFVNEAAGLIHELDPTRPVTIASGDQLYMDLIAKHCPNVDVMGTNIYRGELGFGRQLFQDIKDVIDKPFIVTEFGNSAWGEGYTKEEVEAFQALYLANSWEDLQFHMGGSGVGNVLGGVVFEFMDEWWKANSDLPKYIQNERKEWYQKRAKLYKDLQPGHHDTVPQFGFPFLDGWSYEEWYGLVSQGNGKGSPFARILRPSYFALQEAWSE